MNRFGLALSGGGFRATLYHLGVVRFLRDAGILPKVTHITCVSGGSVLGAHLALNWDKYCGSEEEFAEVADEIVRFVQLDVRNRIVRRFPLAAAVNGLRRLLLQGSSRHLTRPGLLEQHYKKFLYGDTCLFELPESPRLHILTTNVGEGCLCSFTRDGLILQHRAPGRSDRFEKVNVGLATVPMAVAASSAFPGFFPPLRLRAWEVGAKLAEFDRQAFSDGGIFDNLGVRMFRCMEQSWMNETTPLHREDFVDLAATAKALSDVDDLPNKAPLRRIAEMMNTGDPGPIPSPEDADWKTRADEIVDRLRELITSCSLYREESLQSLKLKDVDLQSLLRSQRSARYDPEWADHLSLNRSLLSAALRQATGTECLRATQRGFDKILVSDAGSEFQVYQTGRSGGVLRTAFRASSILMDRVWQLEMENFHNAPGFVFASIGEVVSPAQDPSASHPEIQRRAARIRTDLDYFSDLEISSLVRHGYCVARKTCRSQPEFFGDDLPTEAPWDPCPAEVKKTAEAAADSKQSERATAGSVRQLRNSSARRLVQSLVDFRDWPTYVWLPLILIILCGGPYTFYRMYVRAQRSETVLSAIEQTSPMYKMLLETLSREPLRSVTGVPSTEVESMPPPNFEGFKIIMNTAIYDLRAMTRDANDESPVSVHARMRVVRTGEGSDNTHLRVQRVMREADFQMTCRNTSLNPALTRLALPNGNYQWQFELDFSRVPVGQEVELIRDAILPPEFASQTDDEGRFEFSAPADVGLVTVWVLMPEERKYESLSISRISMDDPSSAEQIIPTVKVELPLGSLITFQIVTPEANFRYECRWKWLD